MKTLTLVAISLSLNGCAIIDSWNPVDMFTEIVIGYPKSYMDGYNDACKTTNVAKGSGNTDHHFSKDEKGYTDGWKDGNARCY